MKNKLRNTLLSVSAVAALGLGSIPSISQATITLDLSGATTDGFINGAYFSTNYIQAAGSGVIDSIVRVSTNQPVVQGYNTTENNVFDTGATDTFNHAITLGLVPIFNIGGVDYRQFALDINQTGKDPLLSLDEIQLFVGGTANSNVETFTGGILDHDGTMVYRLDAGADNGVLLDYSKNAGSGSGDMFFYAPNSLFAGFGAGADVTLYSKFGATPPHGNNDGYEEWYIQKPRDNQVPEPGTMLLLGAGILGLGIMRRKKATA